MNTIPPVVRAHLALGMSEVYRRRVYDELALARHARTWWRIGDARFHLSVAQLLRRLAARWAQLARSGERP